MLYDGGSAGTVPTNLHIVTIVCLQLEHKVSYEYQKAIHFWSLFLEISWKMYQEKNRDV